MKLYEIDKSIEELIDTETGEILDFEKLDELQLAREQKIESIALAYKNACSDAAAFKAEKAVFEEKEKRAKNTAESLKNYLTYALQGGVFMSSKVSVTYRKSEAVSIAEGVELPEKYTKVTVEPDKTAIKNAIKSGIEISGCAIEEKQNLQIK